MMSDAILQTHHDNCWQDRKHHACALRKIKDLQAENEKLKAAINKTIADNLQLADGDNCTLIDLKMAVEEVKG